MTSKELRAYKSGYEAGFKVGRNMRDSKPGPKPGTQGLTALRSSYSIAMSQVDCSMCGAKAGQKCVTPQTGKVKPFNASHVARYRAMMELRGAVAGK